MDAAKVQHIRELIPLIEHYVMLGKVRNIPRVHWNQLVDLFNEISPKKLAYNCCYRNCQKMVYTIKTHYATIL